MIKTKSHKPTVTVAVSAYNEEKNIGKFLKSILTQKEEGFKLEKILVVSDGSTDRTVAKAKEIKSPKIEVVEHLVRTGKSSILNEIYRSLESDILVQSDADVYFAHPHVIRDLIQPLSYDEDIGMCGGNPTPLRGRTFTEKAVNTTCAIYINFRKSVRGGNNKFSADGRLLAYRKKFIKGVVIPVDMIANDAFTYYCCLTTGFKYWFIDSAIVHFRSPQTLRDQVRQKTRFSASPIRMSRYFPEELVRTESKVPSGILIKSMIKQFMKHPILCLYIFLVNKYCLVRARFIESKLDAKWPVAETTKSLN